MTGHRSFTETAPPAQIASPGTAPDGKSSRRRGRRGPKWTTIAIFLAPALVLFIAMVLVPIVLAGYAGFFTWNGYGGLPTDFTGFDNFTRAFEDDVFIGDLRRGAILVVLSLVIQLPASLMLALLLNQNLPGRAIFRLLFFAPFVVAEAIVGVLFILIFSPNQGLANEILGGIGLSSWQSTWFADPDIVLYVLFFVISWRYFGFHMILFLAGLQNIPRELHEAAAVDGATRWQSFRSVTLPLLGPTIRLIIFLSVIGTIQLFDLVWITTGGGPINASETMAVTMYRHGFERFEVGYASAISIIMFLISLVFALFYQRLVMRRDLQGALTNVGGR